MKEKIKFRRQALSIRNQIADREGKSAAIADFLFKTTYFQRAKTIFLYCSYRSEVDTNIILETAWLQGKRVAIPKVLDNQMQFFQIHARDEILTGYRGIPEPEGKGEPVFPQKDDLILVPGTAFDKEGYRMGYGGGYYDRYLAKNRTGCITIGLAFLEQLYDQIPKDEYDICLDNIVTERGLVKHEDYTFNSRKD